MNIHCKYDELVKCSTLKPHPKNRNKHPDDQIERLAKILKYQGIRAPIVVSKRSGKITKGHGTLQAIKKNGWQEAPVVYQDFEDDDQEWLFVQSDNAIAMWAELDLKGINADLSELGPFDIDLIGIKDFEVEPLDKLLGDEDAVPDVKPTDIKLGDLFVLGDHRLLCGDSTDAAQVERLMNGEKADMVFTDPPYGVSVVQKSSALKELGYREIKNDTNIETALNAFNVCTKLTNNLIFWGGNYFAHQLPKAGSWIVWRKKENDSDQHDFEVAWLSQNKKMACYTHTWSGFWRDSENGNQRVHPTQKPIALAEWCFENYGNPKTVIDLFGGSGSTLIACEKTNRKCFMMELDPQYCQVIIDRWEQYTGKKAVKDASGTTT